MTSLCRYDADDLFAVYIHKGWDEVLNIIKGHLEECDRLDAAGVVELLQRNVLISIPEGENFDLMYTYKRRENVV